MALPRLHLGCGEHAAAGWLNHDRAPGPGVDLVADLTRGLPLDDASVGAVVGIHLLQDLAWPDIPPVLAEVHRVLAPGGWLRLALPDLERAVDAFRRGDARRPAAAGDHRLGR
ncbi:class I SAM-dependent methyltransferase [Aquabacterium sp. J223]|uniref:class I SAM-dependent methyltransferase n=1 Tax=Aquabacterium sp. J223 TaxID=2898431 RepID=UPI0021AD9C12|nr:methyltransferase domain-containing protein [Aquabacterium sp. J223]UUX95065.1 methyltransferase domain-containing protein [Aquabacterium sp. J223]